MQAALLVPYHQARCRAHGGAHVRLLLLLPVGGHATVALAVYAAASIGEAGLLASGLQAVKFAAAGFIVPFFVDNPVALLGAMARSWRGRYGVDRCGGAGGQFGGLFLRPASWFERALFFGRAPADRPRFCNRRHRHWRARIRPADREGARRIRSCTGRRETMSSTQLTALTLIAGVLIVGTLMLEFCDYTLPDVTRGASTAASPVSTLRLSRTRPLVCLILDQIGRALRRPGIDDERFAAASTRLRPCARRTSPCCSPPSRWPTSSARPLPRRRLIDRCSAVRNSRLRHRLRGSIRPKVGQRHQATTS